jgi:hypothetical protein
MKTAPVEIRFIRIEHCDAWMRMGWHNTGRLPGGHGLWSCALEWLCDCPIPVPAVVAP